MSYLHSTTCQGAVGSGVKATSSGLSTSYPMKSFGEHVVRKCGTRALHDPSAGFLSLVLNALVLCTGSGSRYPSIGPFLTN